MTQNCQRRKDQKVPKDSKMPSMKMQKSVRIKRARNCHMKIPKMPTNLPPHIIFAIIGHHHSHGFFFQSSLSLLLPFPFLDCVRGVLNFWAAPKLRLISGDDDDACAAFWASVGAVRRNYWWGEKMDSGIGLDGLCRPLIKLSRAYPILSAPVFLVMVERRKCGGGGGRPPNGAKSVNRRGIGPKPPKMEGNDEF
jgi:hypothetical protein